MRLSKKKDDSINILYRYRPLQSILEFKELENLEIYFSKMEELNDPMEGYFMPFYKGDKQHWKRFFIEYFQETLSNYVQSRENKIFVDPNKISYLINEYMECNTVNKLLEQLCNVETHITSYDFRYFMQYFVHPFTFFFIGYFVEKELICQNIKSIEDLKNKSNELLCEILENQMLKSIIFCHDTDERMKKLNDMVWEWKKFAYDNKNDSVRMPIISMVNSIIGNIEKRYRANYLSASYTTRNNNATMWSHYANKQNGVCLGFNFYTDKKGKYAKFSIPNECLYFTKITYTDKLLSKDTAFDLLRIMDLPFYDFQVRKQAIEEQKTLYTYKTNDWSYEDEYRLLLPESSMGMQKMKYDISELKEIIFGCNVSIDDRLKIINIVRNVCKNNKKHSCDVKFKEVVFGLEGPIVDDIYEIQYSPK